MGDVSEDVQQDDGILDTARQILQTKKRPVSYFLTAWENQVYNTVVLLRFLLFNPDQKLHNPRLKCSGVFLRINYEKKIPNKSIMINPWVSSVLISFSVLKTVIGTGHWAHILNRIMASESQIRSFFRLCKKEENKFQGSFMYEAAFIKYSNWSFFKSIHFNKSCNICSFNKFAAPAESHSVSHPQHYLIGYTSRGAYQDWRLLCLTDTWWQTFPASQPMGF